MNNSIECLENRIAPAAIIDSKTLLYTDIDGDPVKLTITTKSGAGIFGLAKESEQNGLANRFLGFANTQNGYIQSAVDGVSSRPEQLKLIDLTAINPVFADGVNISVKVLPNTIPGADGQANVGLIKAGSPDADNLRFVPHADLGKVSIDGDLYGIYAGDPYIDQAIKSLEVKSIGVVGTSEPRYSLASGFFESQVFGPIGKLRVHGDVNLSIFRVIGQQYGDIKDLNIEGVVRGLISFTGTLEKGQIGALEGSGIETGSIEGNRIGKLQIEGSVTGGVGINSGRIQVNQLNKLVIGQDLSAGAGDSSGIVYVTGSAGKVEIYGSINGTGSSAAGEGGSGQVYVNGKLKSIHVFGDLIGGEADASGKITAATLGTAQVDGAVFGGEGVQSGYISVSGNAKRIFIDGKLDGSTGDFVEEVEEGDDIIHYSGYQSGSIGVVGRVDELVINGDLIGGKNNETGGVVAGSIASMQIGGSLKGALGSFSGGISVAGLLKSGVVNGSILGGDNYEGMSVYQVHSSGFIAAGRIAKLTITGSIVAGINADGSGSYPLTNSGSISAVTTIGRLEIGGNVSGDLTYLTNEALITAGGNPLSKNNVAIESLVIKGNVNLATVLTGYVWDYNSSSSKYELVDFDSSASIGSVSIAGYFANSNIAAGTVRGSDGYFGTQDDRPITDAFNDRPSFIRSVEIEGIVINTIGEVSGISAAEVINVVVQGVTQPLIPGASNDNLAIVPLGVPNSNVRIFEVPQTI